MRQDEDGSMTSGWQFDKRLPVALIVAVHVQAFSSLWWAASFSARTEARLEQAERRQAIHDQIAKELGETQAVLAQQLAVNAATTQAVVALTAKIDARLDQIYRPNLNGR